MFKTENFNFTHLIQFGFIKEGKLVKEEEHQFSTDGINYKKFQSAVS